MSRNRCLAVLFLAVGALLGGHLVARPRAVESEARLEQRPGDEMRAAREKFLDDFQRIGLNTTPGDAVFLRILVKAMEAKRGVEVGTATGYGALHMGMAFEESGGELITIDIDPRMVEKARANIREVKLEKTVKVIEGDALKVLPTLEGEFDFVFLDAVKRDYLKYYQLIEPKLADEAVIVADNVIKSRAQMQDFLDAMEKRPGCDMVIIRCSEMKGDGMAVIHWRR